MENLNLGDLSAFQDLAERFSKKEIAPHTLERDRYPFADFQEDAVKVAASVGLLSLTLPEKYGGMGHGMSALGAVLEVIARTDASMAAIILTQALSRAMLIELGPPATADKWAALPKSGDTLLLAFPLYTDPENLPETTSAKQEGNVYKLDGAFDYLACLPVAKGAIVPAKMVNSDKMGFFLVETHAAGVTLSEPVVSLGLRGCPAADLNLKGVSVSAANLLGGEGRDKKFAQVVERFRGPVAAIAVGILKGAYYAALDYAKGRYQAKKQIIEHDMVRRMLSGMMSWIDLASPAAAHACMVADRGEKCSPSELLSIQEIVTTAVTRATTDGVQVLGGYG
jgi:alkylation response protein AidB-like acyl-CoA dehydrogenase